MPEEFSPRPSGNPERVFDYIARQITGLVAAELGERSAVLFRFYEDGMGIREIARGQSIPVEQVQQSLKGVYAWMGHRFSKQRLRMLLELPDPPISKEALDELYARLSNMSDAEEYSSEPKSKTETGTHYTTPLDNLNLSMRSYNALSTMGITTVEALCGLTENQILMSRNSGPKTLRNIKDALAAVGLSLKH